MRGKGGKEGGWRKGGESWKRVRAGSRGEGGRREEEEREGEEGGIGRDRGEGG